MIVSLNEIAATAAKAIRGCGHPEGIAEDVGYATRWLCARGLPGVAVLLTALDGFEPTEVTLVNRGDGRSVVADGGAQLPIPALRVAPSLVEVAVVDRRSSGAVRLDALTHPLLLAPFVDRHRSNRVSVRWSTPEGPVVVEPADDGVQVRANGLLSLDSTVGREVVVGVAVSRPADGTVPPVLLSAGDFEATASRSVDNGCAVADVDWSRLADLAWRTYVPVSDGSRERGAGAGLTDND